MKPTRHNPRAARTPLPRMAWLDEHLRSCRYPTARMMMDAFLVTERTFLRDLAYLREEGAPIAFDQRRRGYYYTRCDFRLPAVRLSEGELLAVFVAEKVLQQYAGTPYESELRSAFEKIVALLPDQVSVKLQNLGDLLSFNLGPARPADLPMLRRPHPCSHSRLHANPARACSPACLHRPGTIRVASPTENPLKFR